MVYNGLKEVVPFHKSGHIYNIVPRTYPHLYVNKPPPSYICPTC